MKRTTILLLLISTVTFAQNTYKAVPQNVEYKDTTRVLCIGNSFTYFFDTDQILTEIACSQGHFMTAKAITAGGYSFGCHLNDPKTLKVLINKSANPYDIVFLQNQSIQNALFAREPGRYKFVLDETKELVGKVRVESPDAKIFLESTWANPNNNFGTFGSPENFDEYMWKGSCTIARKARINVSPIGKGFAVCRADHPEIDLLYKDRHHQSMNGAYLKACVNYIIIFGGEFAPETSNCGLEPEVAKALQAAAQKAVNQL